MKDFGLSEMARMGCLLHIHGRFFLLTPAAQFSVRGNRLKLKRFIQRQAKARVAEVLKGKPHA